MKEYCVDLEIARELKKNGFPQETHNNWLKERKKFRIIGATNQIYQKRVLWSAPCSEEILKELPKVINDFSLDITTSETSYFIDYTRMCSVDNLEGLFDDIETGLDWNTHLANSLAKMWLYLKKEKYI